jgi:hypothetical protein
MRSLTDDVLAVGVNDRDRSVPRLSDLLTEIELPTVEPNQ